VTVKKMGSVSKGNLRQGGKEENIVGGGIPQNATKRKKETENKLFHVRPREEPTTVTNRAEAKKKKGQGNAIVCSLTSEHGPERRRIYL